MFRCDLRFSFRTWLLFVLVWVPLACSGSSRNGASTHDRTPAETRVLEAAPPSPDPCEQAAGLRARVRLFLADGRLHRTVKLIEKADRLCPRTAPETWAALVATLAELGKYTEARKVAGQIEADAAVSWAVPILQLAGIGGSQMKKLIDPGLLLNPGTLLEVL